MGNATSAIDPNGNVYCEHHVLKEATAFCTTHKQTICMSCIVQKVHLKDDCKLQDIDEVDRSIKQCLCIKQKITKFESKQDVDEIESQMETEIEAAFSNAMKKLEEYKRASYETSRREVKELIESKRALYSKTKHQLDTAIDLYMSGNAVKGQKIKMDVLDERLNTKITFQQVIPSFGHYEKSLVKVTEENQFYIIPHESKEIDRPAKTFKQALDLKMMPANRLDRMPRESTETDIPTQNFDHACKDSEDVVDGKR